MRRVSLATFSTTNCVTYLPCYFRDWSFVSNSKTFFVIHWTIYWFSVYVVHKHWITQPQLIINTTPRRSRRRPSLARVSNLHIHTYCIFISNRDSWQRNLINQGLYNKARLPPCCWRVATRELLERVEGHSSDAAWRQRAAAPFRLKGCKYITHNGTRCLNSLHWDSCKWNISM